MTSKLPPPGSAEAIREGCSCDPEVNRYGEGIAGEGGPTFEADWQCPVHGVEAVKEFADAADADAGRVCIICGGPIDIEAFKELGWDSVEAALICAKCVPTEDEAGPRLH